MRQFPNFGSENEQPLLSRRRHQQVESSSRKKSLGLSLLLIASLCVFFFSYLNQPSTQVGTALSHLGGSSLDVAVGTRDCDSGLFCRAVLQVAQTPDGWDFFAGYLIYSTDSTVERNVPSSTRSRVQKVTEAEAKSWATHLLDTLSTKMNISRISITVDDVASGIMKQKDVAATCTRTGNIECKAIAVVASSVCKRETFEHVKCEEFWMSPRLMPQSYDAVLEEIPYCVTKSRYYNYDAINAPLCTMDCEEGGKDCVPLPRTVFAEFFVKGDSAPENLDCFISKMKVLHSFHEVKPCDQLDFFPHSGEVYVYSRASPNAPLIQQDECGNLINYAFFKLESLDIAGETCASTNCPRPNAHALDCYGTFLSKNPTFESFQDWKNKTSSCGGHFSTNSSVTMNVPICKNFCARESCPPYGIIGSAPATITASGSMDCIAASFLKILNTLFGISNCIEYPYSDSILTYYDAKEPYASVFGMDDLVQCGATVSKVFLDLRGISRPTC